MRLFNQLTNPIALGKPALAGLLLANAAYFLHNPLGWIITLGFFLLVPGYLLLRLLGPVIPSVWEKLALSSGLSIVVLMAGGLLLNGLHVFGVNEPLGQFACFAILNIITAVFIWLNRRKTFQLPAKPKRRLSSEQLAVVVSLTLLPLLSIGGAIRLNNGGSNILTMIMFGATAALFVLLMVRRKQHQLLYPYAIFTMALSVLFAISLRGWTITGHDIHHEFEVFQAVAQSGYWNASPTIKDPYNACLSITILPALLGKISSIAAPFIYKVIFQLIFALGVTAVYSLMKRLSDARVALAGAFVFISFPPFLNDMPFLNRQEMAFVFFALLMLVNFSNILRRPKTILTTLLLLGLILSHYSSGYVLLGVMLAAWAFYKALTYKRSDIQKKYIPILSLPIILTALLFTFLWNTQVTSTAPNIKRTIERGIKSLSEDNKSQSSGVSYSLFAPQVKSPSEKLTDYAGKNADRVQYVPEKYLADTPIGNAMSHVVKPETFNKTVRSISAKLLQVLLLLGIIIMFFRQRRKTAQDDIYFYALVLGSFSLLVLMTVLPQVSAEYSVTRLFQQTLVIIGMPIILATSWLMTRLGKRQWLGVAVLYAFLFAHLSGFVPQAIGGYPPQMALNNTGTNYDVYYEHAGELVSARWMSENDHNQKIAADLYARMQLPDFPFNKEYVRNPVLIGDKADYLYNDYANTQTGLYTIFLQGDLIRYRYQDHAASRNLLYVNATSNIYGAYDER